MPSDARARSTDQPVYRGSIVLAGNSFTGVLINR